MKRAGVTRGRAAGPAAAAAPRDAANPMPPPARPALLPLALALSLAAAGGAEVGLPTDNDALFRDRPEDFYQYVERDFEGQKTQPWEAGQFGMMRDPARLGDRLFFRKFHEGIDIRAMRRDAGGRPLDEVRSIAAGEVAHVSTVAGYSNYGRYVVVCHRWEGALYYSLYAHLATADVQPGQTVAKGQRLGVMGFTGEGVDIQRAHLHLEVCLLLNRGFEEWHRTCFPTEINRHGLYNGLNLVGLDVARLLAAWRANPGLPLAAVIQREPAVFRVAVPGPQPPPIATRYPWLLDAPPPPRTGTAGKPAAPAASGGRAPSWEITFAGTGLPLRVTPGERPVAAPPKPQLVAVEPVAGRLSWATRGLLTGEPGTARLSAAGERYLALITWPEPAGAAP